MVAQSLFVRKQHTYVHLVQLHSVLGQAPATAAAARQTTVTAARHYEVDLGLILNVVIGNLHQTEDFERRHAQTLQLNVPEDKTLLMCHDAVLSPDPRLDVFDRIARRNVQRKACAIHTTDRQREAQLKPILLGPPTKNAVMGKRPIVLQQRLVLGGHFNLDF